MTHFLIYLPTSLLKTFVYGIHSVFVLLFSGLKNTTLALVQKHETTLYNLTSLESIILNINMSADEYVFVSTNTACNMRSALRGSSDSWAGILHISIDSGECSDLEKPDQSQWVFVIRKSLLIIVCPCQTNLTLWTASTDVIRTPAIRALSTDNLTSLFIYSFENLSEGIYKVSSDKLLSKCYHLLQALDETVQEIQQKTSEVDWVSTESTVRKKDSDKSQLSSIKDTLINIYKKTFGNRTLTNNKSVGSDLNDTSENFEQYLNNTSTYKQTSTNSMQDYVRPLKDLTSKPLDEELNTEHSVNDRFNMVVDIVQTNANTQNLMAYDLKEGLKNGPTYVVNVDTVDYSESNGGKSLFAVILSLIGALLAVAVFILGFVLSDFLSRRNQLRNTRIRPFVSYY